MVEGKNVAGSYDGYSLFWADDAFHVKNPLAEMSDDTRRGKYNNMSDEGYHALLDYTRSRGRVFGGNSHMEAFRFFERHVVDMIAHSSYGVSPKEVFDEEFAKFFGAIRECYVKMLGLDD